MGVVLCENQRFGHGGTPRKDLDEKPIAKGLDYSADLVGCDYGTVKFARVIGEVFIKLHPSDSACLPIPFVDVESLVNLASTRSDLSSDLVDIVVDVDAVSYRPFMTVLHHKVLLEESESLFVWSGREPDEIRIEVFEYLSPKIVNRPVALVSYDEIKGLNGYLRIVGDRKRALEN